MKHVMKCQDDGIIHWEMERSEEVHCKTEESPNRTENTMISYRAGEE